jgi:hypothetical protein
MERGVGVTPGHGLSHTDTADGLCAAWCVCGWMTRSSVADSLHFLARHIDGARRETAEQRGMATVS